MSKIKNFSIPTVEKLKHDLFFQSLKWCKEILRNTCFMPYLGVIGAEHSGKFICLSVGFDFNNNVYFVKSDAIDVNLVNLTHMLSSFLDESINIVNGYMEKNHHGMYKKIEFVVLHSNRDDFKANVLLQHSGSDIIDRILNHDYRPLLRSLPNALLLDVETEYVKRFVADINSLKEKLNDISLAEFGDSLINLIIKYSNT